MIVHFEDKDYQLDLDEIDVREARVIKRQTGMSLLKWQEGLEEADPDSLVALYWLMLSQNGVAVDMSKVNFKVIKFGQAVSDAFKAEAESDEEDPTSPPVDSEQPTT